MMQCLSERLAKDIAIGVIPENNYGTLRVLRLVCVFVAHGGNCCHFSESSSGDNFTFPTPAIFLKGTHYLSDFCDIGDVVDNKNRE